MLLLSDVYLSFDHLLDYLDLFDFVELVHCLLHNLTEEDNLIECVWTFVLNVYGHLF